jgi:hypothetical protein
MHTGTQPRPSAALRGRVQGRVRRAAAATGSRPEQRLDAARRRELHARRELALALARADETYTAAVRRLDDFDGYMNGVRRRLQQAGYLAPTRRRPGSAALGAVDESFGNASRREHGDGWNGKASFRIAAAVALRSGH